jgi:hypothetical protein
MARRGWGRTKKYLCVQIRFLCRLHWGWTVTCLRMLCCSRMYQRIMQSRAEIYVDTCDILICYVVRHVYMHSHVQGRHVPFMYHAPMPCIVGLVHASHVLHLSTISSSRCPACIGYSCRITSTIQWIQVQGLVLKPCLRTCMLNSSSERLDSTYLFISKE